MNHTFTTAEIRLIKDNPDLTDRQLGEMMGLSKSQVWSFRRRMGLKKDHAKFSQKGADFWKEHRVVIVKR